MSENRARYTIEGIDRVSQPFKAATNQTLRLAEAMRLLDRASQAAARSAQVASAGAQAVAAAGAAAVRAARARGARRGGGVGAAAGAASQGAGASSSEERAAAQAARAAQRASRPRRGNRPGMDAAGGALDRRANRVARRSTDWRTQIWSLSHLANVGRAAVDSFAQAAEIAGTAASLGVQAVGALVTEATTQERSMATLTQAFGDAAVARQEFNRAVSIAARTPLSTQDVVNLTAQAAGAGFRGPELSRVRALLTDVAASRGTDVAQQALLGIGQMRSRGQMTMGDLNQITNSLLVNRQDIFTNIARNRGMRGTQSQLVAQVEALSRHGRVTADEGLTAAFQAYSRGRPLGSLTDEMSRGLSGSISNFRDIIPSLVQSVDLSRVDGLQRFGDALRNVSNLLGPTTRLGGRLRETLVSMGSGVLSTLFGDFSNGERAERTLETALDVLEQMSPRVQEAAAAIRQMVGGFGTGFLETWRTLGNTGPATQTEAWTSIGTSAGQLVGFLAAAASHGNTLMAAMERVWWVWEHLPGNFALGLLAQGYAAATDNGPRLTAEAQERNIAYQRVQNERAGAGRSAAAPGAGDQRTVNIANLTVQVPDARAAADVVNGTPARPLGGRMFL